MVIISSKQEEPGSDNDSISLTSTILSAHSENELFEVKKILAENPESKTATFLIQWEGYPVSRATWEPRRQIRHLRPIIKEWRQRQKMEQSGILDSFDTQAWATARDESEDERQSRKIRRAIKRKRLQRAANPELDWDVQLYLKGKKSQELNDKAGLEGTPRNITKDELKVRYKPKNQTPTLPKNSRNRRKVISDDDEATEPLTQDTVTSNLRRSESPFISFFQAQPKNSASPVFEKNISPQLPHVSPKKMPQTQPGKRSTLLSDPSSSSDESLAQILRRSRAQQSSSTHTNKASIHPEEEPQATISRPHSGSSSSEDVPLAKHSQRRCRRQKLVALTNVLDLSTNPVNMSLSGKITPLILDEQNSNEKDESIFLPDNTCELGNLKIRPQRARSNESLPIIKDEPQIQPSLIDIKMNDKEQGKTGNGSSSIMAPEIDTGIADNSNLSFLRRPSPDAIFKGASSIKTTGKEKCAQGDTSEATPRLEVQLGHNYKELRLLKQVKTPESHGPHLLLDRKNKSSSPRIPIQTESDVCSSGFNFNLGRSSSCEPRAKEPRCTTLAQNQDKNVEETFRHISDTKDTQNFKTSFRAGESIKFSEDDKNIAPGLRLDLESSLKNHLSPPPIDSFNNQISNHSSQNEKSNSKNLIPFPNLDSNPSSNLPRSPPIDNQSNATLPHVSNFRSDTVSDISTPKISLLYDKPSTIDRDRRGNSGLSAKALFRPEDKTCNNIAPRSSYSLNDEISKENGVTRNSIEILTNSFQANEFNIKGPKHSKPGDLSSRNSAAPKQGFEESLNQKSDKGNHSLNKIQQESQTFTSSTHNEIKKGKILLFKPTESPTPLAPTDAQKTCQNDHQKTSSSITVPCSINEASHLQSIDDLKSKTVQVPALHTDKRFFTNSPDEPVNLKIGISKQRSMNSINSIVKEVVLGNGNQNSVFLKFGKLESSAENKLKSTIHAVDKIHFNHLCIAQDFQTQDRLKKYPVLWQENISIDNPNDKDAMKIIQMVFDQLVLRSAGLTATVTDYTILIFPVRREEWRFIDQLPEVSPEFRLRYSIFSNKASDRQLFLLDAGKRITNKSPLFFQESKKALIMELLHDFIPKWKKCSRLCRYYLLFPPAASRMADFVKFCLTFSNNNLKVYGSMTEGSWDHFSQDNESAKDEFFRVVLIHELAITEIFRIPNLSVILNNTDTVFWQFSDGSLRRPLYPSNYPNPKTRFGDITATELFPHGCAVLLTPSFLVAEPKAAFEFIRWFIVERIQKQIPPCRFVGAHNLTSFVLDVAKSKASEAASYERRHAKNPRKNHVLHERLLDYTTCNIRWCLYSELSKLNEYNLTDLGFEENSESCLIQAPSIINADNEHELIRWFAAWSLMRSDIFRKFIVVGTGSSNAPQAKYLKEFSRKDRDPKQNFRTATSQSLVNKFVGTKDPQKDVVDERLSMFQRVQTLDSIVAEVSPVRKIASTCTSPTMTIDNASRNLSSSVNSRLNYHPNCDHDDHGPISQDHVDKLLKNTSSVKNQISPSEVGNGDEKGHIWESKTNSDVEFENKGSQQPRIGIDGKATHQSVTGLKELKELKFEATTEWYQRLKARGSGWEHITITEYPNAWQLLDFKSPSE